MAEDARDLDTVARPRTPFRRVMTPTWATFGKDAPRQLRRGADQMSPNWGTG